MNYICITNQESIAEIAECAGVEYVMIDLEIIGKHERQGHMNTFISTHTKEDIGKIKKTLRTTKTLVRVNPLNDNSKDEIEYALDNGADALMLPMFKNKDEAEKFVCLVKNRAEVILLLETPSALNSIDKIVEIGGVSYIHVGLNDLSIAMSYKFMFMPLINGMVERVATASNKRGVKFGFGGIAQIGEGLLPAELILAEHIRLNSCMTILSRSFLNCGVGSEQNAIRNEFSSGMRKLREYEKEIIKQSQNFFDQNKEKVFKIVTQLSL